MPGTYASDQEPLLHVEAADPRIQFTDGHRLVVNEAEGSVHFDRVIGGPKDRFRWDSPGSRARWRTDADRVVARIRYSPRHDAGTRNGLGRFRIDGRGNPDWRFQPHATDGADLEIEFPTPGDGAFHDYEIILPYAEAIDLLSVAVPIDSRWRTPTPRPDTRYVAFGDSVTQGFTASDVAHSYAFLAAESNEWELINLAVGGRGTNGPDGAFLAGVNADIYSILIGVNDWQAGADLASFRKQYRMLLSDLLSGQQFASVVVITPLWVPPSWKPKAAKYPLEDYRIVMRGVVAELDDSRIALVEGPSLIDHNPALFDPVAVHPNDAGFAQMAERLAPALRATLNEERSP